MRLHLLAPALLAAVAFAAAGCGSGGGGKKKAAVSSPPRATSCPKAWLLGWQRLADRIDAPVYCPGWMPHPLTGQIGGPWNSVRSVDPDRSYLISFLWQEKSEEIHVNLRGYPGRTTIPRCRDVQLTAGKKRERQIPCFSDARGQKRAGGIFATMYTVNQDADQWHVLYAWRHRGSLYAVSEHVAPPFTYRRVVQNLDRLLRTLVLVEPRSS